MSLKSFIKGWIGETLGAMAHWAFLDRKTYHALNNVTLQTSNGTTQIDHIIVSRYGIFVIEAKNYKGWIFGEADSPQWTQSLYGRNYPFQNPLHQNYRHIRSLQELLGCDDEDFFSIVMFWGDCELKTPLPENVMTHGYGLYIKRQREVRFTDEEVADIVAEIKAAMLAKGLINSFITRRRHRQSLTERHAAARETCPNCGHPLVLRTARHGANAGQPFYGCSSFPACRYTCDAG